MRRALTCLTAAALVVAVTNSVQSASADPPPAGSSIVLASGLNNTGQLATGNTTNSATPIPDKLPAGLTITSLSAGFVHGLALASTGALYAWGDNTYGELGNGTTSTTPTTTPALVNVPAGVTFTAVSAGYYDSLALASDGSVYAWGFNGLGQLGIGTAANALLPTKVALPAGVVAAAASAGFGHSLFLTATGLVYGAGANNLGQLGTGTTTNTTSPVQAHLPSGTTATGISAGFGHSLALTSAGGVLGWGYNANGQVGNNSTTNALLPVSVSFGSGVTATAVSAGDLHSAALTSTGGVFVWGDNSSGQLGNGTNTGNSKVPVAANLGGATAVSVAASYGHTVVRTSTGGALAWGYNQYGQTGTGGGTLNVLSPTAVKLPPGASVSLVGLGSYSDATLFVISPVVTTTTVTSSANPATVGQSVTFTATVSPSDGTGTVAFSVDGATIPGCGAVALKASGSNLQATCSAGPLGGGSHPVSAAYSGTSIYLASSANLSPDQSVTSAQGKVVGWGYNGTAQLGTPAPAVATLPVAAALPTGVTVTQAAVGYGHGLALTTAGTVYAWGDDQVGELGNGSTAPAGTNAPPAVVPLPDGATPVAVSVGYLTSYVLTAAGKVYAFGANNLGQLGIGSTANASTPTAVALPAGVVVTSVSAGFAHALALASNGAVYSWGWNGSGQLGNLTTTNATSPVLVRLPLGTFATGVAAGYNHSLALTTSGVLAWGDNTDGELGNGGTTSSTAPVSVTLGSTSVAAVTAGYLTSAARTSTGGAVAWGLNNVGQLGDGTTNNATAPVAVALPSGVTVTSVVAEYSNGAALTSTGAVYAWGANNLGQLGNGTVAGSNTPTLVKLPPGTTASGIGSSVYAPSTVAIVNEVDTSTSITSSASTAPQGTAVTFTATVTPSDGSGTVSFFADGSATPIQGCAALPLKHLGTAYLATCAASTLGVGGHPISAAYSGTPVYHASGADLSGGVTVTSTAGVAAGWGLNNAGQLGTGDTATRRLPTAAGLPVGTQVTKVAGGYAHTLALTADGSVYAWGDNASGELGNGTTNASTSPVQVSFPDGTVVVDVAVGTATSMALTSTGAVYAWGLNNFGQVGDGTTTNRTTPTLVSLPSGTVVSAIALGNAHALALTASGSLYSWGHNNAGQLGVGTTTDSSTPALVHLPSGASATAIAAGVTHSLAVTNVGLYAWGDNSSGEIGVGVIGGQTANPLPVALPGGAAAAAVTAGNLTSGAVTTDGQAFTWGANNVGQLGNGGTTASSSPTAVALPGGTVVSSLTLEWGSGVALVAGGSVYSWGDNSFGELGNGGTAASATPALVVLPYGGHAVAAAGGAFTLDTGVVIPRIASTTTVLPAATVTYGQATILQANVAPTDGGGTLAFFADGSSTPISGCESATWFASFVTPGQWAATCAPVLAVGTHSITAKFSGDRFYLPSDGTLADAATVNQAPTTTTVTASPNPGTLGQPETLTATVGGTDGGGTVSFASDGSTITGCDMVPLAMTSGAWTATCVTSDLARGPHSISATYTGDTSYAGSSGTMGGQLVIQVPTTLTAVNVHILSSLGGLKIRFQATLTETISGAPIAGQQVTFTSSLLGLNTKCVGTTDANGVATCQATVNALLGGGYDATFAGTALYQPSTSHAQVLL